MQLKTKKFFFPIIFLGIILVILTIAFFWWRQNAAAASGNPTARDFLVVRGQSASQIGGDLYKAGLIKSPLAFKIYVQFLGKAARLQSGQFRISPSYSLVKVADTLTASPAELWVTIPEGLRREETVERFIKGLEVGAGQATDFRREFLDESKGQEGFLFPDTYLFARAAKASAIVKRMHSTFELKMKEFEEDVASSDLSLNELVTLASIIERETKANEERSVVAGILLNRLKIGMGLAADATVQYAIGTYENWWPVLTREDLKINSPFNTYRFRGLPPSPIANPGLSSLKAAINPEGSDYLYYLHDPGGVIHYAKTLAEHNENVRKYLGK